jgi:CDP-glucose 4,6-dehydratase
MIRRPDPGFWRGKRVLVTGHTGFKGSWLVLMLRRLGATVHGLALDPAQGDGAFGHLGVAPLLACDRRVDIRDAPATREAVGAAAPDIVLHLAAQALVGASYADPAGTFATNVQGTINVLEPLRGLAGCKACLVVTSDKVYRNDGSGRPFRESDPLGGHDPYSASKAACEIAVGSWAASFARELPPIGTGRAGNVIGGGDFGPARLIPDLVRAEKAGEALVVRRPGATRPFQHVLDVLAGYLLLAEDLASRADAPRAVNFGPTEPELAVRDLLTAYGAARGRPVEWTLADGPVMAEAPRLALDSSLSREALHWVPRLGGRAGLAATAAWYDAWAAGGDLAALSRAQVAEVLE